MKNIICILLVCTALSGTAQHHKNGKVDYAFTRSLGANFQQFDGLNSRTANLPQFKQLKDYTGTLGLGWLKSYNRLISNGGIVAGSSMSGDRDERSSALRFLGLHADVGYDLLKSEKIMLYPLAGLGLQGYQAIFYKDNSAVSFDDVLQSSIVKNSISSVKFNNSFFVYRLGMGVSVKSARYPSKSIGVQAGYAGSFKKNAWKSNENQALGNAPRDRISQFHVGLIVANKPWFMK